MFNKEKSRFSALLDDVPIIKREKVVNFDIKDVNKLDKFEQKKAEKPEYSCFRPLDDKEKERRRLKRETDIKEQRKYEEEKREKIKQESLKINTVNFPELVVDLKKDKIVSNNESYINKLKKEEIIINDEKDEDLADLLPGWVLYKKDTSTGKTIIKKHEDKNINILELENKIEEDNEYVDMINSLVNIHEKRKQQFIENYGYDEWEKLFKFPNWIEDEAYLEQLEEEFQTDDENEDEDEYE